jgi:hypothetical protein
LTGTTLSRTFVTSEPGHPDSNRITSLKRARITVEHDAAWITLDAITVPQPEPSGTEP